MGTKNFSNYSDMITFSRASTGTYLDSDGLLKSAAINTPRVEYDYQGNRLGLLVEEARTNVVLYSSDVAQSTWVKRGSASSQKIATDIFGNANSASRVSIGQSGVNDFYEAAYNTVRFSVSVAVSPSFYIKTISTTGTLSVQNAINGSTVGRWLIDLSLLSTTAYEHITETHPAVTVDVPFVSNTSGHGGFLFCSNTIDIISFDIDGIQLEQGSFPTSYIPTSGATATRSQDTADISTSAFGFNSKLSGTLFVEGTFIGDPYNGDFGFFATLGSGINDQKFLIRARLGDSGDSVHFTTTSAANPATTPASFFVSLGQNAKNAPHKIAGSIGGGQYLGAANGLTGSATYTGDLWTPNQIEIGRHGSAYRTTGHIKSIAYYPRKLTDAQIKALTSPPETPTLSLTFDDSSTSYLETSIHG